MTKTTDKKSSVQKETQHTPTLDDMLQKNLVEDPKIELNLPWDQVKPIYDRTLNQAARHLRQDGFRPGKVPASIAEERLDKGYLAEQVVRHLVGPIYQKALEESKLKVFADPEFVITKADKNADWQVVAYLPQKTEVTLPKTYEKFLKDKKKELTTSIKKQQAEAAEHAKQHGHEAPTPLTDEQIRARATDESLLALMQELQPKVSTVLVRRAAGRQFENFMQQLQQYKVSYQDYLKNTGMADEAVSGQFMLRAMEDLQLEFMLDALMEKRGIKVNDKDLVAKMKEAMPSVTDEKEQQQQLEEPSVRAYLETLAKRQKLADWLLALE
ncbi:hypothetical protein IJI99_01320 [bacterium]|nr:hypothetical protein [bacterium]